MKRILGLDLGTASIGWALVEEKEKDSETSSIVKLGVRVIQYDTFNKSNGKESKDPTKDFASGKGLSPNASRTQKRGARRTLQRFKLRRKYLKSLLIKNGFISKDTPLTEVGKNTTFQTLRLRNLAVKEKLELHELARVLLSINKKRGYKSNRKTDSKEEGNSVDSIDVAKKLYDEDITPGEYALKLLNDGEKFVPDFYRSDLKNEFKKIWEFQKQFYPNQLSNKLYSELQEKNKTQTWGICKEPFQIVGIKDKLKPSERKRKNYERRVNGLRDKLDLEELAIVLQEINNDINKTSGYLGNISDRSKELYIGGKTVGQFLYNQIKENRHQSLKNQVFYRQDYLDEFEKIWEFQKQFYLKTLTEALKKEIRDCVIFYQRPLKSQKGLLSFCQFENWERTFKDDKGNEKTRTEGRKVIPRSSPLFQEFRIWQNLNNLKFTNSSTYDSFEVRDLPLEIKQRIFDELNIRGRLEPSKILKIIKNQTYKFDLSRPSQWKSQFKIVEGNTTNQPLHEVYHKILEYEGCGHKWDEKTASEKKNEIKDVFKHLGVETSILEFDYDKDFDQQKSYQLWHLLYSAVDDKEASEEDRLKYGNTNVSIRKILHKKFGFPIEYAKILSNVTFEQDYGNLSSKAIKKIIPHLIKGSLYNEACQEAGYNHSESLTREQLERRVLKDRLKLLPKNSLRNPVVEKILNQMINLINQIIDYYGKPDEIRIELSRELKKSAKEREDMTKHISDATKINEEIRQKLKDEFNITHPTKNDVVRFKLWKELESRAYKDIYRNKYISRQNLFSKNIEIEHIIPKSLLFDDSYSNKTLSFKDDNITKSDRTAYDFIKEEYSDDLSNYEERINDLYKGKHISKGKYNKLLMPQDKLPQDFIERDLRNTQYIAKKAKEILEEVFRTVVPTTGKITDRLRKDWELINIIKELSLPKYKALGLTEKQYRRSNNEIEVIKLQKNSKGESEIWSKREDHRHHAMDALTVAFTSRSHIQYLNNLNARKDENSLMRSSIIAIEDKITRKRKNGTRIFVSPFSNMRSESKKHIESILVSFKASNKIMTNNKNKINCRNESKNTQLTLTPRGQLHMETVYGKIKQPKNKPTRLGKSFKTTDVELIINPEERKIVHDYLKDFDNEPKKAFDSRNLKKNPLTYNNKPLKEVHCFEEIFTIRKDISPDIKIDKVIDPDAQEILRNRLRSFRNPKEAFSNLEKNPIWVNKEKGIKLKRIKIKGVNNAIPIHKSKDHLGKVILDENNKPYQADFVSSGNNHHVAIYKDINGSLHEKVTSFFEAVERVNQGLDPIDRQFNSNIGWQFCFTMKKNEMFLLPSEVDEFFPDKIEWTPDERGVYKNVDHKIISRNLFRIQKIASRNYVFRHHLETSVVNDLDFTFKMFRSTKHLGGIQKIRVNHIGDIVQIGEY